MDTWKPILNRHKSKFNNKVFPDNFRCLIIGSSGCGKNVLLMRMLLEDGFLDYNNLIFYSTTINQPELQLLKCGFENKLTKKAIIDIFKNQHTYPEEVFHPCDMVDWYKEKILESDISNKNDYIGDGIQILFSNKPEDVLHCDLLPKDKKNLVIFDDVVNMKNQEIQKSYFTRGRHNNCNVIYISQTYYALDKNSIRNNSNCFIFFKLDKRDKNMIYNDLFSNVEPDKNMFDMFVDNHWREKYNYIYLDREEAEIWKSLF